MSVLGKAVGRRWKDGESERNLIPARCGWWVKRVRYE